MRFALPVRTGVTVDGLARVGDRFVATSGARRFEADNVVLALVRTSAPPPALDPAIVQLHSSAYRRPSQLRARAVPSSWAPATRGPRSPWRRPAGTGPGCRGGTRGTSWSAPGAGPSGWSFP